MKRGLIGGILLTIGGIVVFIFTVFLFMNLESMEPIPAREWRLLIPLIGAPVLIFVGIKSLYFQYLERKLTA